MITRTGKNGWNFISDAQLETQKEEELKNSHIPTNDSNEISAEVEEARAKANYEENKHQLKWTEEQPPAPDHY